MLIAKLQCFEAFGSAPVYRHNFRKFVKQEIDTLKSRPIVF